MKERVMQQKPRTQRDYPDPQLYMPAMPPLGLLNAFERRVQKWWRQRAERRHHFWTCLLYTSPSPRDRG